MGKRWLNGAGNTIIRNYKKQSLMALIVELIYSKPHIKTALTF
jgi:hypothetical protein